MGFFKKILSNASKEIINASKDIVNESMSMLVETTSLLTGEKKTQAVREAINEPDVISSSFSEKAVMRCPNCGIETDSKFCPECGTKIVKEAGAGETCPNCGIETDSKFSPECGTKIVKEAGAGATAAQACPPIPTMTESPKAPIKPIKEVVFEASDESIKEHTSNGVLRIPDGVTTIKKGDNTHFSRDMVNEIIFPSTLRIIGDNAFEFFRKIQRLTIPNSVTSIGKQAFYSCDRLTSITIPNSVTNIGSGAFYCHVECLRWNAIDIKTLPWDWITGSNIKQVVINEDVEVIPDNFLRGALIESLDIPDSVKIIGDDAFYDCTCLTHLVIGNSVTKIGKSAFKSCTGLTSVTIPNSVTKIGDSAFSDCTGLTSITIGNAVTSIGNSVTSIGKEAFYRCDSLTNVTIGNSVTSIGENAFSGCSSLTNITIPDSVTSIGEDAFRSCDRLTSITIGNAVTSIGNDAFDSHIECLRWNVIDIKTLPDDWIDRENIKQVVINEDVEVIPDNFLYLTLIESLDIPDSVKIIGDNAFDKCRQLKKVKFGNNVEQIGICAFIECSGLIGEFVIPNSVIHIGKEAFSGCNGLTSVTIGNSVTSIGEYAFYECSFDKLVIPDSVVSIGEQAFASNNNLRVATIGKSAKNYFNESRPIFESCGELTELTVRSEVAEYTGAKSLTKITICDTVKELGQWAFCECPNLEEVVVPDSVTKIGYGAFANDENLKTIELSDSITEIGEAAFSGTRLKEIVLPKELSKIGRLGGDMYKLRKLDFAKVSKLRVIPENFLGDCPKVKELVIPMGVTTIEEKIGGDNLNDLFLPPTIEEIEELHQMDLNIYCFAPEIDELESLTGDEDKDNNIFHPNHLFVLPQYLDAYRGQQVAEGISEDLLTIDVIPEEYQYYYEN